MASPMLRGEVSLADLDPVRGSGADKRRPAVVVSNDRANAIAARLGRGVVSVVPVTSNTDRIFPFQALLPAAAEDRTQPLDWDGVNLLAQLDDALRLPLQL